MLASLYEDLHMIYHYSISIRLFLKELLPILNLNILSKKNLWVGHICFYSQTNLQFCFIFRIAPALLRQASYGTIKIGVYHTLKRAIVPNPEGKIS